MSLIRYPRFRFVTLFGLVAGLLAVSTLVARAGGVSGCTPKLLASLEITTTPDGGIAVPVMIDGQAHQFTLNLLGPSSRIPQQLASDLNLRDIYRKRSTAEQLQLDSFVAGAALPMSDIVVVEAETIQIGDIVVRNVPTRTVKIPNFEGELGLSFFSNYDLELDIASNQMKLYASDDCIATAPPWSERFWTLPLERQPTGHIFTHVVLDGHEVSASFGPEFPHTTLEMNVATQIYGLTPNSVGMVPTSPDTQRSPQRPTFKHTFSSLVADGMAFSNLQMLTNGTADDPICDGTPHKVVRMTFACFKGGSLVLGLNEMRQMHLYFAFKQGKVFFTAAKTNP